MKSCKTCQHATESGNMIKCEIGVANECPNKFFGLWKEKNNESLCMSCIGCECDDGKFMLSCTAYRNKQELKPPLGVMPESIHNLKRIQDLSRAILEWVDELKRRLEQL